MQLIQDGPPLTERKRLTGTRQPRGTKLGLPTWGGFLFGVPFVGIGVALLYMGLSRLHAQPHPHFPAHRFTLTDGWMFVWFGTVFPLAGLLVWSMTIRQYRANARRRQQLAGSPLADYNWDARGFGTHRWREAVKTTAWAAGLTYFLTAFNYLVFTDKSTPWMARGIVGVFDAVTLWLWIYSGIQYLRAMKFGNSRIEFDRFPYRVGEPVRIRWVPPRGMSDVRGGTFMLRCVQETTVGSGEHRSVLFEHLWSETWRVSGANALRVGEEVAASFAPPKDMSATNLGGAAGPVIYWELETKFDLPGLDFAETYLVPVYG